MARDGSYEPSHLDLHCLHTCSLLFLQSQTLQLFSGFVVHTFSTHWTLQFKAEECTLEKVIVLKPFIDSILGLKHKRRPAKITGSDEDDDEDETYNEPDIPMEMDDG